MHRATGKGPFSRLTAWGAEDTFTTNALGFAGDNRTLYLLTSVGSNTTELRSLDVDTRHETRLASDPKADVAGVLTHPTTHEALAVRFGRERSDWKVLDESVVKDFAALREVNDGDLEVIGADCANRNWLVCTIRMTARSAISPGAATSARPDSCSCTVRRSRTCHSQRCGP